MPRILAILVAPVLLASAGCTIERQSVPPRTATEQLLISTAVDRAVERLELEIPKGTKVLVDADNFEGIDEKYAIGAIRDKIARAGGHLVPTRGEADMVVEIRSGALSIDESRTLIGIPSVEVPVPTAENIRLPEFALWKRHRQQGVAKLALTGYATDDGRLTAATGPIYGFSHRTDYVALLLITWTGENLVPPQEERRR